MEKSTNDLLKAWRDLSLTHPPYILANDKIIKEYCQPYKCFKDYVKKPDSAIESPEKFHCGLIPVPYQGDILKATIYILALNPGFGPHDYYAESHDRAFRNARIQQLRQRGLDKDFPFMGLNPLFSWHSRYWTNRLGDIIGILKKHKNLSYRQASSLLSKSIACLEYIPYHSKIFGLKRAVINEMQSPKLIKSFVHDYVVPKAINGVAIIIAIRKVKRWELPKNPNIVVYEGAQARAGYLNSKSPGGKMILKVMGL